MTDADKTDHRAVVATVVRAAHELGIELDIEEAEAWIASVSVEAAGGSLVVDVNSGVYGHRVTMADHDPVDLARFRHVARVVGLDDRPPEVLTALALSGSAAQSRVHRFPGDCDFFERVHLKTATREQACALLGDVIREKALATLAGPGHRFAEAKFGTWHTDGTIGGVPFRAGSPINWTPDQVEGGAIDYQDSDGNPSVLTWAQAAEEPGWCKLDWVVADPEHGGVSNASNVLDATWEAPDGTVIPLDGFLDPYFQEVYLDLESIPLFTKLVNEMGADSVAEYVERLNDEVYKYTVKESNHGKAARRMYNVFRLTGQYAEAAYVRELFDEPVTALYQVSSLLRTIHEAADGHETFETEAMVAQVDQLIMSAVTAFQGRTEATIVDRLLRLREAIGRQARAVEIGEEIDRCRSEAIEAVDEYFKRVLTAVPSIKTYLQAVASAG